MTPASAGRSSRRSAPLRARRRLQRRNRSDERRRRTWATSSRGSLRMEAAPLRRSVAAPGRRRLPPLLDRPERLARDPARGRPWCSDHGERRRDTWLLVQPADRAVLPRRDRRRFPYRVYGGQQESGSAGVESRGDDGQITFRLAPGRRREVRLRRAGPAASHLTSTAARSRFDRRTGDVRNVSPDPLRKAGWRSVRTMPVVFLARRSARAAARRERRVSRRSTAASTGAISPDLTRESTTRRPAWARFAAQDGEKGASRRRLHDRAIAARDLIWAGTDDGSCT